MQKKVLLKKFVFFAQILTVTACQIIYNVKSTEYCNFYCGSQSVAQEKP